MHSSNSNKLAELFQQRLNVWRQFAPVYTVICIIVFAGFSLYKGVWRYAGMHEIKLR